MFIYTSIYLDDSPVEGRAIDVWMPRKSPRPQAVFFVHGGGWRQGRRDLMHDLMEGFCDQGYICISTDYRTAGVTALTQLGDVTDGMAAASHHLGSLGFPDWPFVLYGSSAGGHLALLAGLAPELCQAQLFPGSDRPPVVGMIACCAPVTFEPWDDMFPESWSTMEAAAGTPFASDPSLYKTLSPQTHASKDSPPTIFLLGECEHMFPNALTIGLVETLQSLGVHAQYQIYKNAEHGFFYALTRPAQKAAFQDVMDFLDRLSLSQ